MTLRIFLAGSLFALFAGFLGLSLTITQLDPDQAGALGLILLFVSIFISLTGFMSLLGYGARRLFIPGQFPVYAVRVSTRQALMVSIFGCVSLGLQLSRLYQWWVGLILIILLIFIELAFLKTSHGDSRRAT